MQQFLQAHGRMQAAKNGPADHLGTQTALNLTFIVAQQVTVAAHGIAGVTGKRCPALLDCRAVWGGG